jgi:hypothetical protein
LPVGRATEEYVDRHNEDNIETEHINEEKKNQKPSITNLLVTYLE